MKRFLCLPALLLALSIPAMGQVQRGLGYGDKVADVDMPTWTILWWQWAFSMDQRVSPVRDRTGARCAINQSGPVWYLSGGFGVDQIVRYCTIPTNRHLFFPVINLVHALDDNDPASCPEARQGSAMRNTDLLETWLRVDGVDVSADIMLLSSPECFDLTARAPRAAKVPPQFPAATSGLWAMLPPLPPGEHIVQFGARDTRGGRPNDGIIQAVEYVLTVTDD